MTQSGHSDDGNASIRNRQLVSAANCLGVGEGMPHYVNRLAPMSIREPVNGGSSAADNRDRGANAGLRHMSLVAAAQVPHRTSSMEALGRTPLLRTAAGRDMSTSGSSPTRRKRRLQL